MDYYPIFLKLRRQHCLVVGGGDVGFRKTSLLLESGALVTVVSPEFTAQFSELFHELSQGQSQNNNLNLITREFSTNDLKDKRLVIAATDKPLVNKSIADQADVLGILVNVPDDVINCRFILPSIIDRSPIMIALSSGGISPVLIRLLRRKLETLIPASYGRLAKFAGQFRSLVKTSLDSVNKRRQFWEYILEGPIAKQVLVGKEHLAKEELHKVLASFSKGQSNIQGEVFLVGAGPGDSELLTLKALRLMQEADIVFYDNLVSKEVLNLIRRDAHRISVAKKKNHHKMSQSDINSALIEHAKMGKRVCRLKGGDPFIFGRGGEEAQALAEANVPFQIVPGITAASGCTTYAGIPLTHRDYADCVTYITGHKKESGELDINFEQLVNKRQTLVFYMSLGHITEICARLQINGLSGETPAAAIEQGTTSAQRNLISSVAELAEAVKRDKFTSPTLIVIGRVVELADSLAWFGEEAPRLNTSQYKSNTQ